MKCWYCQKPVAISQLTDHNMGHLKSFMEKSYPGFYKMANGKSFDNIKSFYCHLIKHFKSGKATNLTIRHFRRALNKKALGLTDQEYSLKLLSCLICNAKKKAEDRQDAGKS